MDFHPVDAPRVSPAESPDGAPAPVNAASPRTGPAPAPFAWAVGHPVSAGAGGRPDWLRFLAPGVASGDDWLDFLRR